MFVDTTNLHEIDTAATTREREDRRESKACAANGGPYAPCGRGSVFVACFCRMFLDAVTMRA